MSSMKRKSPDILARNERKKYPSRKQAIVLQWLYEGSPDLGYMKIYLDGLEKIGFVGIASDGIPYVIAAGREWLKKNIYGDSKCQIPK